MNRFDIVIIGQGPAGLSAAIYTSRAGMRTLILGCEPKVAGDYDIDNYFGFPETISGKELIARGCRQAQRFGTQLRCDRALAIHPTDDGRFSVTTESGETIQSCAVILATGVTRVKPGVNNISDYEGKGVSYCVSCDGFFFRNKKVMVLGEAIFAANQAMELTQYTPDVIICTQSRQPSMTEAFLQRLEETGIELRNAQVVSLEGHPGLERVVFADGSKETVDGLFVAMGQASSMDFAYSLGVARNGLFLEVDNEQKTNIAGVFAAGDCVGRFLQISVAVGEGAVAGRSAINYVKKGGK